MVNNNVLANNMENTIVRKINLFTLIILVMFALIPPVSAISPTDKLLDPLVLGQHLIPKWSPSKIY